MRDHRIVLAGIISGVAVLALLIGVVAWPGRGFGSRTVLFGLDVPGADLSQVDRFSTAVGSRPRAISLFIKLDTVGTAGKLDVVRAAGYIPFVTLEPWVVTSRSAAEPEFSLASIVDGRHDAALRHQAEAIAASGGRVFLRFAHEMNGNWYPWGATVNGNTSEEYVAAWRHVHRLFAQIPGLSASWVWSPATNNPGSPARAPGAFYPGDSYVDFVGLTGYEHTDARPSQTFGSSLAELSATTHRPVILAEVGADGPNKATWLASLGAYIADEAAVVGFVYYDTSPATTGASGSYALTTPTEFAALRSSLAALDGGRPHLGVPVP